MCHEPHPLKEHHHHGEHGHQHEEHHHHGEHNREGHAHHDKHHHHGMDNQSCCVDQQSCCSGPHIHRHFVSKEERVTKLEAYKQELSQELAGVEQEIRKLREA